MLYFLGTAGDEYIVLNLFRYLTFRSGAAVVTALVVAFVLGPWVIAWLKRHQPNGQPIRDDGPRGHFDKAGTPTMGGFLILLASIVATLLWADLRNGYVWATLLVMVGFGAIGFADDYLKLARRHSRGLPGKLKFLCQIVIATVATVWIMSITPAPLSTSFAVPFFKDFLLDFDWMFLPVAVFVMVGASNAVNLTDGLDGLAIVPVMIAAGCFAFIAYLVGNTVFANYLQIHYVAGTGELAVFCGSLIGAGLGFLWFNAPPAMVFMGDTGSLSMGGALGSHQPS